MRKMKHYENKINLSPFLFPMSLLLPFATLSKPTVGLALGKRDGPKVICLNATEGFDCVTVYSHCVRSLSLFFFQSFSLNYRIYLYLFNVICVFCVCLHVYIVCMSCIQIDETYVSNK